METIFASTRRSLPPVPRSAADRAGEQATADAPPAHAAPAVAAPAALARVDRSPAGEQSAEGRGPLDDEDPAQVFVARLRAAAADFAAAAGAHSAVVREAVPPARHRRSRCRVVLRYADGGEADLTFLGPVGRPGVETHAGFDASIQRWLATGQQRAAAWLVPDEDAQDGVAVDVTAWLVEG